MNEEFTANTKVSGVPAGRIAGVLQAEAGFFAGKRYEGLLGVAQAIRDMAVSGRYGTGLERVLRYHFLSPKRRYHADCLRAVYDVFCGGAPRERTWRILALRFSGGRRRPKRLAAGKGDGLVPLGADRAGAFRGVCYYGEFRALTERGIATALSKREEP